MPLSLHSRPVTLTAAALLLLGGFASEVSGQSRRSRRQPTQPAQPAAPQPGQAQATPELEPSPFIQRVRPRRWLLNTQIFIGASEFYENVDGVNMPRHDNWEFDSATLVFPVVQETGSSILEVFGTGSEEKPAVSGVVEFNDRPLADEVEIVTQDIGGGLLPCATWRAQWQVVPSERGAHSGREMEFVIETRQVCYETKFDDAGASKVEWPTGPWPAEAAACLRRPEMFVDFGPNGAGYDMSPVGALIEKWTGGKDPRTVKPVVLAKYLAAQVVEHSQVSGEGLAFDKTGLWKGFDTPGAAELAATGRGTEVDLPCLLVAVYRGVGLPARVVIGYDDEGEGEQVYLKSSGGASEIRVWVEFALYDEANKTFGWVPVDVTAIRKKQSRLPKNYLERPMEYFGTHDELDGVAPIAFHFHPPTTVRSYGAPAFWGWFVTPTPPGRAVQRVKFELTRTPSGGNDQSRLPADKRR